jgi:hypothetical protein
MQVGGLQRICRRRLCQRGPRFVRCGCRGELRGRGRGKGGGGTGKEGRTRIMFLTPARGMVDGSGGM